MFAYFGVYTSPSKYFNANFMFNLFIRKNYHAFYIFLIYRWLITREHIFLWNGHIDIFFCNNILSFFFFFWLITKEFRVVLVLELYILFYYNLEFFSIKVGETNSWRFLLALTENRFLNLRYILLLFFFLFNNRRKRWWLICRLLSIKWRKRWIASLSNHHFTSCSSSPCFLTLFTHSIHHARHLTPLPICLPRFTSSTWISSLSKCHQFEERLLMVLSSVKWFLVLLLLILTARTTVFWGNHKSTTWGRLVVVVKGLVSDWGGLSTKEFIRGLQGLLLQGFKFLISKRLATRTRGRVIW